MSVIAALLKEATDTDLDLLADLLAPRLARLTTPETNTWLRGADQIAAHLGCVRSRVYALSSAGRLPVQHDGSALIARKHDLDTWLQAGGAKRP